MNHIQSRPLTSPLALGDVMLNPTTGELVDVVLISTTLVTYKRRADYKGPLGSSNYSEFIRDFEWIRNSNVLYMCWLEPGVQW